MKVFDDMEREQADMYRWMRRNMTPDFFNDLTGKDMFADNLDVDRELREAHHLDRAAMFAKASVQASKLRVGLLPPELGAALSAYTTAFVDRATFEEGLSGKTYADVGRELEAKFLALCEEMAKLRGNL